jgi:hypothetical protein
MISAIPWGVIIGALAATIALVILLKSFAMPRSFAQNQHQRDELRRKKTAREEKAEKREAP